LAAIIAVDVVDSSRLEGANKAQPLAGNDTVLGKDILGDGVNAAVRLDGVSQPAAFAALGSSIK
jgi:hypothetical protein